MFFKLLLDGFLSSAHPEIVDFGSGQSRSKFETAGVATLRRGFQMSENTGLGQKMLFLDGHLVSSTKHSD
jgi:hypothetical protein